MISLELLEYIKAQRSYNVGKEPIAEALLGVGWTRIDIDEAFAVLDTETVSNPAIAITAPDFWGHELDADKARIIEEHTAEEDRGMKSTGQIVEETIRARFPEGLTVMPRPSPDVFAKEGGIPMRPADDDLAEKKESVWKGARNAVIIIFAFALLLGGAYLLKPEWFASVPALFGSGI